MKKLSFFISLLLFVTSALFAQVSINSDGSAPNPSAMLDVKSTNAGFLFPRLSDGARNSIPSPGTGLLIYNTSANRLNYFNGTQWYEVEISVSSSTTGSLIPGAGVSINEANIPPESSAMLDINNASRGVLIPRTIPGSVTGPARGLIIYNYETNRINYYNGNAWQELCAITTGASGSTGTQNSVGVAINTNGASADPSAILEVSSDDKGVLIPRLTENQKNSILPVTGLTIYNLDSDEIEFYNGSVWCRLIVNSLSAPTEGTHVASPTQIVWNWNAVPGADGYKWSAANDFATATDMGTITTKTETGLNCNTVYTRYAWAYSACGNSTALSLLQAIPACPFSCGSSVTVSHVEGMVAPVTKTVTYGTVTNMPGEPLKCWITSNLGADHQASSVDDETESSAGWYWQFNRRQGYKHDGTDRTPNTPWITYISENQDWQPADDPCTLLMGGIWRLPTFTEWYNIDNACGWIDWNGSWNSALKMHAAGYLYNDLLYARGSFGAYWSSSQYGSSQAYGWYLQITDGYSVMAGSGKSGGLPVRCVRDY